jgi:thiamine pyrophosphate-dependent acetolactate synthase large subunit-like protein
VGFRAIDPGGAPAAPAGAIPSPERLDERLEAQMSRLAALGVALKQIGREPVVHANGYICRESFSISDRPQSFYMIGSMGLAPAIGLGIALASPSTTPVIFDGDGNLLMNLGILAQVGAAQPRRFVHCVFDNEAYGSTGNQRSPSRDVRLERLAAAAGYRSSIAVTAPGELEAAFRTALAAEGPQFILAKITREETDVPRIPYTPHELRDRFRAALIAG